MNQVTYIVSPQSAKLTRDTDTFSKMDPYVRMTMPGGNVEQCMPHEGGGKNPRWSGYIWQFPKIGNQDIRVEVWDSDGTSDDKVGAGILHVDYITQQDQIIQVPLSYKNKRVGTI